MAVTHPTDPRRQRSPWPFHPGLRVRSERALRVGRRLSSLLDALSDRGVAGLCVEALSDFCRQVNSRPDWELDLELILTGEESVDQIFHQLDAEESREAYREILELCEAVCDGLNSVGMIAAGCDDVEADESCVSVRASVRLRAVREATSLPVQGGQSR